MVHVRQYCRGELKYDLKNPSISIWLGEIYDDDEIEYEDHPWEIDAIEREVGLRHMIFKTLGIHMDTQLDT
tara:strand:- start:319 stop:531 length:213 start_codon:yes stop_codon:yes gene_type:complete